MYLKAKYGCRFLSRDLYVVQPRRIQELLFKHLAKVEIIPGVVCVDGAVRGDIVFLCLGGSLCSIMSEVIFARPSASGDIVVAFVRISGYRALSNIDVDSRLELSLKSRFCKKLSRDSSCVTSVFRRFVERRMSTQIFLNARKRVCSSASCKIRRRTTAEKVVAAVNVTGNRQHNARDGLETCKL